MISIGSVCIYQQKRHVRILLSYFNIKHQLNLSKTALHITFMSNILICYKINFLEKKPYCIGNLFGQDYVANFGKKKNEKIDHVNIDVRKS